MVECKQYMNKTKPDKIESKKYWSKRRRYGYGWTPTTWQGWTVIGVWLTFVFVGSLYYSKAASDSNDGEFTLIYISLVLLSTIPLILISYKTGPKPRWRWGKSDDDDPDLDW